VLAEAARVLRPGGVFLTTVDEDLAAFAADSDIARLAALPDRDRPRPDPQDRPIALRRA
jgi:hypothetical protein